MAASPEELFEYLGKLNIRTETVEHAAVFTVEESDKIKHEIAGGHTKNLFLKDKKGNYFLLIAESTAKIELNRIHTIVGARGRLSFGKPEALKELLGVEPGSVTAFAPMNDTDNKVNVVIDEPLLKHDMINCHPLKNTMTTTISKSDLLNFLEAVKHPALVVQFSVS